MRILVIGSGGREHAILWAMKRSPLVKKLYVAPGNAGISSLATIASLDSTNQQEIVTFCQEHKIDFVFIGPEAPLVAGLHDTLNKHGILSLGPGKDAAQLEGSKAFTKYICDKYQIPTAAYASFTDATKAKAYLQGCTLPIVIKADGLAAGKGVIIAQTQAEAFEAVDLMLTNKSFGAASDTIVIEEFLEGEEISYFVLSDGKNVIPFGSAQDHKTVGEGDTGPNTGGMGTYSPAPIFTKALEKNVINQIILPLIKGMANENMPYQGVLFAGLMITKEGAKLLEINVRFGDPETQVLMARLKSDLVPLLVAAAKGELASHTVNMHDYAALCVVMAAKGYPGDYQKGSVIGNLEALESLNDVVVFHAGTAFNDKHEFTANGGRVLGITALGKTVKEAQACAYQAVDLVDWPEGFCRRDIGWRAINSF